MTSVAMTFEVRVAVEVSDRGVVTGWWIEQREPGGRWEHRADSDLGPGPFGKWGAEILISLLPWLGSIASVELALQQLARGPFESGPPLRWERAPGGATRKAAESAWRMARNAEG